MEPLDSEEEGSDEMEREGGGGEEGGVTEHNITVTMEFSNLPRVQVVAALMGVSGEVVACKNAVACGSAAFALLLAAEQAPAWSCCLRAHCHLNASVRPVLLSPVTCARKSERNTCIDLFWAQSSCRWLMGHGVLRCQWSRTWRTHRNSCFTLCPQVIDLLMQHGSPEAVMQQLFN